MPKAPDLDTPVINRVDLSDARMKRRLVEMGDAEPSRIKVGSVVDCILRAVDKRQSQKKGPSLEHLFREGLKIRQDESRSG